LEFSTIVNLSCEDKAPKAVAFPLLLSETIFHNNGLEESSSPVTPKSVLRLAFQTALAFQMLKHAKILGRPRLLEKTVFFFSFCWGSIKTGFPLFCFLSFCKNISEHNRQFKIWYINY
jgi:hypothetical protein